MWMIIIRLASVDYTPCMLSTAPPYHARAIREALQTDLEVFPVAVLSGPRQAGKSTLAREGEPFSGRPYLTLDAPDVREQARQAPLDLLQRHERMVLDEVQREPDLLLAAKELIDRERPRRPGRLLLTGSANLLLMKSVADSLSGRAAYRTLFPMCRSEVLGRGVFGRWSALFDAPVDEWPDVLLEDDAPPEDWRATCQRGGFPVPALELPPAARPVWFDGYIRTYLERDLRDLASVQSLPDMRRLMRATALRTGSLLNRAELARDVGLPATTVHRYLGLLETSHLLVRLEPYANKRTKRLIKAPKLYPVDPALGLHLAGGEPTGAHLENLVIIDALAWAEGVSGRRPEVLYWRTASGQEVDLVIEQDDTLLAVEVKTTQRPKASDARHLRAFREEYGDRVHGALLLHGGDQIWRVSEGIVAAPWWRVL